ncbi:cytochrome P450 [Chondromyces apiculatus]|uniref:Putative cytochrome P450 hydroxylase n=1 Tax=Chondromyces apiculatus DSM 436 TaxID=1192034 RepID=A0A017SWC1_9BACT|nr:cytochrome P450 [Chondromyces apiculatus]EYF01032.1 putative cytochrome P450 hydroxylase [Chondromyces apiculatus DSM 436]
MSQDAQSQFSFSALVRSYRDPHPIYAALRAHDGIFFDASSQFWLVTGHAATTAILSDQRFSSDVRFESGASPQADAPSFLRDAIEKGIIFTDGEAHRRVQNVILRVLGRMGKEAPANITAMVRQILAGVRGGEAFDLVKDFAEPLSLLVVAQLLGLPLEDEAHLRKLAAWSDTHGDAVSGYLRVDLQDITRLGGHFREVLAAKREAPGDDLFGAFIQEDAIFVDDDELIINCMMIFGAGRVTTRKVLSNGIPLLLPEWSRWGRAHRGDPTFCKRAAEELLRMVTPTRYLLRCATEDVELSEQFPGDHLIYEGEKLMLFLEAANRDPAVFADPDVFDPDRTTTRHMAFGFGPHYCPGAKLARLEIQIALELLLETFPALGADATFAPRWNPNPNLGGITSFRVCPFRGAAAPRTAEGGQGVELPTGVGAELGINVESSRT